jgi:hypothetical protein
VVKEEIMTNYSIEDLTVIIPVRYRRDTLIRATNFYVSTGLPPENIIIMDGSPNKWDKLDQLKNGITYNFNKDLPWINSMQKAFEQVKTLLTVEMPDDDLLFIPQVKEILNEFEDPNVVSVCGQEIALYDDGMEYETFEWVFGKLFNTKNISDPVERIETLWRYFNCKVHNIIRKDVHKFIYDFHVVHEKDIFAIRYFDKTFSFILGALGTSVVTDTIYSFKSQERNAGHLRDFPLVAQEIKEDKTFRHSFMEEDLSALCSFVNISKDKMKDLHSAFHSDSKHEAKKKYGKLLPLLTDSTRLKPLKRDHKFLSYDIISPKDVLSEYTFPCLKLKNREELDTYYYYMDKHKIDTWWTRS